MPDLARFARRHKLLMLTVADLIRYRMQTERLVRKVADADLPTARPKVLAPRDPGVKSPNGHSVYVGEGEKLWLMHDDDGDDAAENELVLLLHGCLVGLVRG